MEAEDTVGELFEVDKIGLTQWEQDLIQRHKRQQAEISHKEGRAEGRKEGRKEVVETFDYDICSMAERFPTTKELTDFINKWQAKLKEWL